MAEARHVAGLPLVNTEIPLVGQWHVKKRFNPRRALALLFFLRFFSIRSTIKQLNCSAEIGAFERETDVFRHTMLRVRKVPWRVQAPFLDASLQYRGYISNIAKRLESKRNDNRAAITTCPEYGIGGVAFKIKVERRRGRTCGVAEAAIWVVASISSGIIEHFAPSPVR